MFGDGSWWSAGGLVALGGVEFEVAEEFAGGGVDDADVSVLDEDEDAGSGVGSADADRVEPSGVAEGDLAGGVDAVGSDPVVAVGGAVAGAGFGSGGVGGRRGRPGGQGPVWAVLVVECDERVEQPLQLGEAGGLVGLRGEPVLEGLLEAFDAPMFVKSL